MEAYLATLHQGPLRTTLARLRLGQHWLHTRLGRYGPNRVPYENRWCQHCAMQHMVVDLEEHAIFECLLYQGIRQQQPWMLSGSVCNLQGFMGLPPLQQALFKFKLARNSIQDRDRPLCKGRTAAGSHTPARGLSAHEEIAKCNLPGQLAQHFRLLVQPDVF